MLLWLRRLPGSVWIADLIRRRWLHSGRVLEVSDFDGDLRMQLSLSERMQSQIFWYGYCSRDICITLKRLLAPGMVVVDAGANVGEIAMISAKVVGPSGRVYAFEPVGAIADQLQRNLDLNALSNISVIRLGLSDREGSGSMFHSETRFRDGSVHGGLATLYATTERARLAEDVRLTTLDSFSERAGLSRLDVVKLDIEGAELPALMGAQASLQRFRPYLIIEVQETTSRAAGYEAAEILRFLEPLGYRFEIIGRKGRLRRVAPGELGEFQNVLCSPARSARPLGTAGTA